MSEFGCTACGCPSIEVPRDFSDQAAVLCRDCGRGLGTWGELKLVALTAMRHVGEGTSRRPLTADPMPID